MAFRNGLTLDELSQIEEMAHRSHSREAETILRLSASLREAMQVRENALALMSIFRRDGPAARIKSGFGKLLRD
jgi:hypothetical protein